MSILEMILTLLIPWGAVLWGVNIYHQKGTWFLAGWNTMREEEKASYNEEEMCHLFGRCVIFVEWEHFFCFMAALTRMTISFVVV